LRLKWAGRAYAPAAPHELELRGREKMAQPTIRITNCKASEPHKGVSRGTWLRFCSKDHRSYEVKGLGSVFEDNPNLIVVPAKMCSGLYKVVGAPGSYDYVITGNPACIKDHGTPEIIIEETPPIL
jgi:hypothetical protein